MAVLPTDKWSPQARTEAFDALKSSGLHGLAGRGFMAGISISGLSGTVKMYQENGGGAAYGVAVGSTGLSTVDDLMGGRLFSKIPGVSTSPRLTAGVPMMVGFVPDMVNLTMAKNDDQRNMAAASLGTNAGTTLLLRGSSLAGPEAAVAIMAANYVAQRSITPTLKIADGLLQDDQEHVNIGTLRLKAGGTELLYKTTTPGGVIALTADVVGGAGSITKMTGELLNDGVDWMLSNNTKSAKNPSAYRRGSMPGIPKPYLLGDGLSLVGDGLLWSEKKLNQAADWITETIGLGAELRDTMRNYSKQADAAQARYDEAHRRNLIPPERRELNAHVEAHAKSVQALVALLQKSETVPPRALAEAQKQYEAAYQALRADPMYKVKPGAASDHQQAYHIAYERPAAIDNTGRTPVTHAALQAQRAKEQQQLDARNAAEDELRQFCWNPVTEKFKIDTETQHAQITKAVKIKNNQHLAEQGQAAYGKLQLSYNTAAQSLQADMASIAQSMAVLKTIEQALATDGASSNVPLLTEARTKLEKIEQARAAQLTQLEELEKKTDALAARQKDLKGSNSVYRADAKAKEMDALIATMQEHIQTTQQQLTATTAEPIVQKLATLEEQVKQSTLAPVVAINNETLLTQLIEQNPAMKDGQLQEKVKQEAAQLLAYYTQGVGAPADATATTRDGKFDQQELSEAIAKINEKFKDQGVQIATSSYTSNVKNSASHSPKVV